MKILPSGRIHRAIMIISLLLVTTGASWVTGTPSRSTSVRNREPARLAGTDPYLELSVTPSVATPGTLVTLHITYHYIGLPYTGITIDPSDRVAYEPEISMPCKYNEHPNGCTAITFRTLATGVVTFYAGADGEVFDWGCHCFHWGVATDNGPAILYIVDNVWTVFLPVLQNQSTPE